jgi:hypothetical protein
MWEGLALELGTLIGHYETMTASLKTTTSKEPLKSIESGYLSVDQGGYVNPRIISAVCHGCWMCSPMPDSFGAYVQLELPLQASESTGKSRDLDPSTTSSKVCEPGYN